MWIVTFVGIIVILLLLVASTAFRCLSSNTLASILQIGAIVIFIVLFAFLMIFFLSSSSDYHDNLEEFTKKAKARAKSNYLKQLASTNLTNNANSGNYFNGNNHHSLHHRNITSSIVNSSSKLLTSLLQSSSSSSSSSSMYASSLTVEPSGWRRLNNGSAFVYYSKSTQDNN